MSPSTIFCPEVSTPSDCAAALLPSPSGPESRNRRWRRRPWRRFPPSVSVRPRNLGKPALFCAASTPHTSPVRTFCWTAERTRPLSSASGGRVVSQRIDFLLGEQPPPPLRERAERQIPYCDTHEAQ